MSMETANNLPATQRTSTHETGLSEQEVIARRAQGMGNNVTQPTSRSYREIFLENVFTFINIALFGLGIALVLLGRIGDALISTGVISLNVIVSVVQEIRAKRTLDRIALLTRPRAMVMREGNEREVAPEDLVIGDIVKVGPGDQVVVDGRLIGESRISVDESLLTGEADLVPKLAGDEVYSGSFCVSGEAWYEATRVGAQSYANQMTASARAFRRVLTPLQREVNLAVRIALLIVVYFEFLLAITSLLRHINLGDTVANSTIVAGLVPNGLFLSIALAYAMGAVRILRFGALVQQANAIESLSHVDVLCFDKTGTLTTNQLKVNEFIPLGSMSTDRLRRSVGVMVASATGGNKTATAIAAAAPGRKQPLQAEIPFSSARKWSAVSLVSTEDGNASNDGLLSGILALGAPETLHPYLAETAEADSANWDSITSRVRALAEQGLRVLLVAHISDTTAALEDRGDESILPVGMQPIGLISIRDELRPEAYKTVESFIKAGVRPKIISGDNPETVAALARQAGLKYNEKPVSGSELAAMSEAEFSAVADAATIFGRVTPQQKAHLIHALRQRGHYVAMIGDGVNDVLSLKQADLGVALRSGSQAARGVADLVLMEDSFAVLTPAVQEGQRILNGMQDILKLFLTRITTMGLVIISFLVVGTFPLELRQSSLVTLFSVGIPAILLALWAHPGPLPHGGLVRRLLHFILPPVLITSILALTLFAVDYALELFQTGVLFANRPPNIPDDLTAIQTALTAFLVFCGLFLVIFAEPPTEWWTGGSSLNGDWRPTLLAIGLMLVFLVITFTPPLRSGFTLSPMSLREYALVAAAVTVWVFLVRFIWRTRLLGRFLEVDMLS